LRVDVSAPVGPGAVSGPDVPGDDRHRNLDSQKSNLLFTMFIIDDPLDGIPVGRIPKPLEQDVAPGGVLLLRYHVSQPHLHIERMQDFMQKSLFLLDLAGFPGNRDPVPPKVYISQRISIEYGILVGDLIDHTHDCRMRWSHAITCSPAPARPIQMDWPGLIMG
jgi:hypothetical protein